MDDFSIEAGRSTAVNGEADEDGGSIEESDGTVRDGFSFEAGRSTATIGEADSTVMDVSSAETERLKETQL